MIEGDELELFVRSLRQATETVTGAALDAALVELGWHDALSFDTRTAVSRLFELQGAANAASSALHTVLAHALGHESAAVVLPPLGQWHAPGSLRDGKLEARGLGATEFSRHETVLVVAQVDGSHVAVTAEAGALSQRTVDGLDPSLGLVEVTGRTDAPFDRGAAEVDPTDWPAAVALGQLALGHELVGASRRMLDLACEHALDRVQFGRPIATFQAVRHRLAEALVAVEAAHAALDDAWACGTPEAAAMGKATAGRSARVTARHCQQVLAGIGFTTEHPFHHHVRRVLVLDQLLGSARTLTTELGRDILAQRRLPALLPL